MFLRVSETVFLLALGNLERHDSDGEHNTTHIKLFSFKHCLLIHRCVRCLFRRFSSHMLLVWHVFDWKRHVYGCK